MREHVRQHGEHRRRFQHLQQRVEAEPQGVGVEVRVPGAVSSFVANGFSTIISSQKVLSVRSRESTRLTYRKMSWWSRHAAAIAKKLIRKAA